MRLVDPQEGQSLGLKNVEAAASVRQHLGEMGLGDDGVDDEWITRGIWDPIRVILSIKCDGALRPFEVRGRGCVNRADL